MVKIRVQMKDPDSLYDAISEVIDLELKDLPEDEAEAISDIRREKYGNIAAKWFEYSEYVTIEIDTEAKTSRVVPVEEL